MIVGCIHFGSEICLSPPGQLNKDSDRFREQDQIRYQDPPHLCYFVVTGGVMVDIQVAENPDSLQISTAPGTIYILAPGIELEEVSEYDKQTVCRSADDIRTHDSTAHTVVPDFYRLHSELRRGEVEQEDADLLENFVSSDPQPTLCVAPRELDWLLSKEALAEVLPLNDYDLVFVRYDRSAAQEIIMKQYGDFSDLDSNTLDRLRHSYRFDDPTLPDDKFETRLPFLVPTVGRMLSGGEDGIVFPDAIDTSSSGGLGQLADPMIESESASGVLSGLGDQLPSLATVREDLENADFDSSTLIQQLRDAAPSLIGGILGTGVGMATSTVLPLLLYLFIRKRAKEREESEFYDRFATVLDNRLLPPTVAKLEAKLGVPPRTLKAIHNLSRPETHQKLVELVEQVDPEELEVFQQTMEEHHEAIAALGEEIGSLDARMEQVEGILDSAISGAVQNLDFIERRVLGVEELMLDQSGLDMADFVFVGPFPEQIRQATLDNEVVIVTGTAGCGKTGAIYRAMDRLEARDGFTTCVPQLNAAGEEFIKRGVQSSGGQAPIIVSEFGAPWGIEDSGDLRTLFSSYNETIAESVIIECRSESLERLSNLGGRGLQPSGSSSALLDSAENVRAPDIDAALAHECAFRTAQVIGDGGDELSKISTEEGALETYGLLAKLSVTRLVETGALDQKFDDIINTALGSFINEYETGSLEYRLVRLAAISGGTTEDMMHDVYGDSHASINEAVENLDKYFTNEGSRLTLQPPLLSGVLLRKRFVQHIEPTVQDLVENGHLESVPDVVANLTSSYEFARKQASRTDESTELIEQLRREIGQAAVATLDDDAPARYIDCLNIAFGVPVPTEYLRADALSTWLIELMESGQTPAEIAEEHPISAGLAEGEAVSMLKASVGIGTGYVYSPGASLAEFLAFTVKLAASLQAGIENSGVAVGNFTHTGVIQDLLESVLGMVLLQPRTAEIDIEQWYKSIDQARSELAIVKNMGKSDIPEGFCYQILGGAVGHGLLLSLASGKELSNKNPGLEQIRSFVTEDRTDLVSYFDGVFDRVNKNMNEALLQPILGMILDHWSSRTLPDGSSPPVATIGVQYLTNLGKETGEFGQDISEKRRQSELIHVLETLRHYQEVDSIIEIETKFFARLVDSQTNPAGAHNVYETEWLQACAEVAPEHGVVPNLFEVAVVNALVPFPQKRDEQAEILPRASQDLSLMMADFGPYELFVEAVDDEIEDGALDVAYLLTASTAIAYPDRLTEIIDYFETRTVVYRSQKILTYTPDFSQFDGEVPALEDVEYKKDSESDLGRAREGLLSWGADILPDTSYSVALSILFGTLASPSTASEPVLQPCQHPAFDPSVYIVTSPSVATEAVTELLAQPDALIHIVAGSYTSQQYEGDPIPRLSELIQILLTTADSDDIESLISQRLSELAEDSPGIHEQVISNLD